jgi:hypothetical protein
MASGLDVRPGVACPWPGPRLARGREQLVGVGQPLIQRNHEYAEPERLIPADAGQLAEQLAQLMHRGGRRLKSGRPEKIRTRRPKW